MSVDLASLTDPLKIEIAVPGDFATTFPNMSDPDILQALIAGFWAAKFDGIALQWTCDDSGIVTSIAVGGVDMPREIQQVVVFYAGLKIVINALRVANTMFRASAGGGVEFEVQQSANTLRDILKYLTGQQSLILTRLSDLGTVKAVYIDAFVSRTDSLLFTNSYFTGA